MKYKIFIKSKNRTLVDINNFELKPNYINFLFGESGIGKTLIARAIYGLLDSDDLFITINSEPYDHYRKNPECMLLKENSFFVFQEPSSHLNPLMKLSEQLNEGGLSKIETNIILKRLWQNTNESKLKQLLEVYPKPFRPSGGEKQRILLLMAFKKINKLLSRTEEIMPTFFVFDEPTGSLDNFYRNLFLEILFEKYQQKNFTILLITHDYSMISEVYKKYSMLLDKIVFKELALTNSGLNLTDFSSSDYLDWMKKLSPTISPRANNKPLLLHLESEIFVFDRILSFSKESEPSKTIPLQIREGEMVYLKAGSGVGKTTIAKIIMGLIRAKHLDMQICNFRFNDQTPSSIWRKKIWAKKAGMVFQHADESLNLNSKVKDIFKGLPLKIKYSQNHLLDNLKLVFDSQLDSSFLYKKVLYLSGGQKQRLNLLRTLILSTQLIILDEPLNGLDFFSTIKILNLIHKKQDEGIGMLLISHNEEIFEHMVSKDNVYHLNVKF